MTVPIPDESARRRKVLIASVVAFAVVLVGVGIAFAVMAQRAPKSAPVQVAPMGASTATSSAESSETSVETSGSEESTATSSTTESHEATVPPLHPGRVVRAAKIAFRLGNTVWVSGEDGSAAKSVFTSAQKGEFSLSPDGATIAVMDPSSSTGPLVLVDVATGRQLRVAGVELPGWSPDSSWLAYTAETSSVPSLRRILSDGTGDEHLVTPGAQPKISPDGLSIAYVRSKQSVPQDAHVFYLATRTSKAVPGAQGSLDFAWTPDGSLYFLLQGGSHSAGVLSFANKTLSKSSKVVDLPTPSTTSTVLVPAGLLPSPDGSKIVLTETGDDDYSRMLVVDVGTSKVRSLTTRLDAYPMKWTVDGKAILYVLGNATQQEKTYLYRTAPDGSGNFMIVSGAGR